MDGGNEFLRYDQIWQRVAPALEPYPEAAPNGDTEAAAEARRRPGSSLRPGGGQGSVPGPAWGPDGKPDSGLGSVQGPAWRPEEKPAFRPGPGWKPCPPFQGTDGPETLADFIQEELAEQRQFQALGKTAPPWARPPLRDLAARCGAHARRLMAAYYLAAGERYSPAVSLGQVFPGPWGPALRERYQSRVCAGLRYAQAAERAADPCMVRLFEELSGEEYRSAAELLRLLERGAGN